MTIGTISSPGFFKTWWGTDGKGRENPYTMSTETSFDGIWTRARGDLPPLECAGHQCTGAGVVWNFPTAITDGDVLDRLGKSLRTTKFNAGMFLGEGRESISMIHDTSSRLNDAVSAFRERRTGPLLKALQIIPFTRAAAVTAKAMAAGFLAWNFGWKPLISDMSSGAEALASLASSEGPASTREIISSVVRRVPATMQLGAGSGQIEIGKRVVSVHNLSYDSQVKEGLGLNDPLSLAYDLVPLSFVLNWVIPIGTYLNRLHTASIYDSSARLITSWDRRRVNIGAFSSNLGGTDGQWVGSYKFRSFFMQRLVSQGLSPEPPIPVMSVPPTLFQASTLVSLAIQRIIS